jgi:hypothetical protein
MLQSRRYAYRDLGGGGVQWNLVAGGEGFGGGSGARRVVMCCGLGRRGEWETRRCVCVAATGTQQNTQSSQPGLHRQIGLISPILRSTVPVLALTIASVCAFSTHTHVYVAGNS